jgi:hypothetical protein
MAVSHIMGGGPGTMGNRGNLGGLPGGTMV